MRAPITAVADVEVRAFVAIRLDEAVRAALGAAIEGLRRVARDVAWVVPDNLHLTLKFLGQVRAARTPELVAALTRAASGLAAFEREPRPFSPHVTLGRVRTPRRDLALAEALRAGDAQKFGRLVVERVALMRSDLAPRGARYTEVAAAKLA